MVLLLTLVSCCFLGSTFARYTSRGTGSATVSVAKWDITEGDDSITFNVTNKLSPAMEGYTGSARINSTGKILVATIENSGDVNALVSLNAGTLQLTTATEYGEGVMTDGGVPTEAEVKEVFSMMLYTNTVDNKETATPFSKAINVEASGGTLYVYAEAFWTSDVDDLTGANADLRDTWIGKNVTEISYELSYTAVQNSENPAIA